MKLETSPTKGKISEPLENMLVILVTSDVIGSDLTIHK